MLTAPRNDVTLPSIASLTNQLTTRTLDEPLPANPFDHMFARLSSVVSEYASLSDAILTYRKGTLTLAEKQMLAASVEQVNKATLKLDRLASQPFVPTHFASRSWDSSQRMHHHPSSVELRQMKSQSMRNTTGVSCQRCGATDTPEWRRGPDGLRTLCNACGLFHAKLVKRDGPEKAAIALKNPQTIHNKRGRKKKVM